MPEYLFVLRWLIRGGDEIAALHTINALADEFDKSVVVVTTEAMPSPWSERLSKRVTYFELGRCLAGEADFDRLVLNLNPPKDPIGTVSGLQVRGIQSVERRNARANQF